MNLTDGQIEMIAEACHTVNMLWCASLGDYSQGSWSSTPANLKASIISGVKARLENPDITPAEMHQKWYDFKLADGWQYGVEKNVEKKTHPNMVAYYDLPSAEQAKDHLFSGVVNAFIAAIQVLQPGEEPRAVYVEPHRVLHGHRVGYMSQQCIDCGITVETMEDQAGPDDIPPCAT